MLVKIAKELLKYGLSQISDQAFALLMPHAPDMLLCRGASTIPQVCHYFFFHKDRGASPCISSCAASMDCFTDICSPVEGGMTPAEAMKYIENQLR